MHIYAKPVAVLAKNLFILLMYPVVKKCLFHVVFIINIIRKLKSITSRIIFKINIHIRTKPVHLLVQYINNNFCKDKRGY